MDFFDYMMNNKQSYEAMGNVLQSVAMLARPIGVSKWEPTKQCLKEAVKESIEATAHKILFRVGDSPPFWFREASRAIMCVKMDWRRSFPGERMLKSPTIIEIVMEIIESKDRWGYNLTIMKRPT